jgi:hypothetical protein
MRRAANALPEHINQTTNSQQQLVPHALKVMFSLTQRKPVAPRAQADNSRIRTRKQAAQAGKHAVLGKSGLTAPP